MMSITAKKSGLRYLLLSAAIGLVVIMAMTVYKVYDSQLTQKQLIEKLKEDIALWQTDDKKELAQGVAQPIDLTKKQVRSTVSQQMKDTVIQVFNQVTELNMLEPYKTPNQFEAFGSAFFINEDGDMITNYHVVAEAKAITIQIPSVGKRQFDVDIVGVSPERDLALLRLSQASRVELRELLNRHSLPYLKLGDSDTLQRGDKVMVLGYPLGQQGIKHTSGVISGGQQMQGQHFIQIDAPLNEGNSGGPSLNGRGEVIGVSTAIIKNAQNVGYIIKSNEVKLFLKQLESMPPSKEPILLRKPFLGIIYNNASDSLTDYLKNPQPGGLYVIEAYKNGPLYKAGIQRDDMIYEIDGHPIDIYGEMKGNWGLEDKIFLTDYISRLKEGDDVHVVYYRKGVRKECHAKFTQSALAPVRLVFPGLEKIEYDVIGGLVVMQLTMNHVLLLAQYSADLVQYTTDFRKQMEPPVLVVTHVQLNSPAYRTRTIGKGALIQEINGQKVSTLQDFRKAVLKSSDTGFLTMRTTANMFMALSVNEILHEEEKLASTYFYPLSSTFKELAQKVQEKQHPKH